MTESVPPQAPPVAAPVSPRRQPQAGDRYRWLEILQENVEAFTIALVMALVIKHFSVEAFKIPTGSMEPTLMGERHNGVGDRILVDKSAFLLSGPERWDVIVFRFPMNKSKHFIKRVAGVGGEQLRILRGDIWVRSDDQSEWHIATKPKRVRDELYLPVFPPTGGQADGDPTAWWDGGEGWTVEDFGVLAYDGGPAATLRLQKRIGSTSSARHDGIYGAGDLVTDARVRLRVVPTAPARLSLTWQTGEARETVFELGPAGGSGGSFVRTRRPGRSVSESVPARLAAGQALDLELECVDGEVWAFVNGAPVAHLDEKRSVDDARPLQDFTQSFRLEAEGGALRIENLRVDRDLFYEDDGMYELADGDEGITIPEDHYFVLGDNTASSHDSRKWKLIHVPLKDGREITYYFDRENPPRYEGERTTVEDVDGIERSWVPDDLDPSRPEEYTEPAPFVPRALVVGRAFLVFWPVHPHFPGRFGLIH